MVEVTWDRPIYQFRSSEKYHAIIFVRVNDRAVGFIESFDNEQTWNVTWNVTWNDPIKKGTGVNERNITYDEAIKLIEELL